jgi:hypothetical protein
VSKRSPPAPLKLSTSEVQTLWYATQRRPWRRLALVPAHAGGSVLALAYALAEVGGAGRPSRPRVVSAEGAGLAEVADLVMEFEGAAALEADAPVPQRPLSTERVLVALDSIVSNPMVTAVALSCDAALLCLELGVSDLKSARRTIDQIGRERFVGSVLTRRG